MSQTTTRFEARVIEGDGEVLDAKFCLLLDHDGEEIVGDKFEVVRAAVVEVLAEEGGDPMRVAIVKCETTVLEVFVYPLEY
jgi:hypothetical protein